MSQLYTVVFMCDLKAFEGNPLNAETVFGPVKSCGYGDAFAEADRLRDALEKIADGFGKDAEFAQSVLDSEESA